MNFEEELTRSTELVNNIILSTAGRRLSEDTSGSDELQYECRRETVAASADAPDIQIVRRR